MAESLCAACGAAVLPNALFCGGCGDPLPRSCAVCAAQLPAGARFCHICGARVVEHAGQGGAAAARAEGPGSGEGEGMRPPDQAARSIEQQLVGAATGSLYAPPIDDERTRVLQMGEERRVVTVLFGDLSGFTELSEQHDAEAVKLALDSTFRHLAQVIEDFGGTIDKFIGDNVMATFGAPTAHENDPERAVRAALAMRDLLSEENSRIEVERGFSFEMRIGVNTGEVMAGRLGADREDAYTVMGDAVNVASRLERAAEPGQILVGPATRALCPRTILFSPGVRISVKGKAQPIEAFEALGVAGEPSTHAREPSEEREDERSPFVGRDEELAVLLSVVRTAREQKRPYLVTVLGELGSGKTRMLEEAAQRLEPEGIDFLWGRVPPYGSASSFAPVADMVKKACGVQDDDDLQASRKKISDAVADLLEGNPAGQAGGLARRLLDSIGMGEDAGSRFRPRDAASPVGRFFEALTYDKPVVLVFDNLHFADDELLSLVEDLPERVQDQPLVVVASALPELLERRPDWGAGKRHAHTISVEALDSSDTRAFLVEFLGAKPIAPEALETIAVRAGGNPLFLAELASFLRSEGILEEADGRWEIPDQRRVAELPHSLRAVVAARLDRIPVAEKELLQIASVVGETFWAGALAMITGADEGEVRVYLDRLVERDLLISSASGTLHGESEYRFKSTLTQQVARRSLPKSRRGRLHTLAGAWLEARAREAREQQALDRAGEPVGIVEMLDPLGGFLDEITYHYEQAARLAEGEEEEIARHRAHAFLTRAAREAVNRALFLRADDLYGRAREMGELDAEALEGRGAALLGLGRWEEAERELEEALTDVALGGGNKAVEARVFSRMADLRVRQALPGEALELADMAIRLSQELEDRPGEIDALLTRGRIYLRTGRTPEAFTDFALGRNFARDAGDARQEAWALLNMAWCRYNAGYFSGAKELIEEALVRFSSITEVDGVGWCVVLLGWIDSLNGILAEPRDSAEALSRLAHDIGEYWGEGICAILACSTSVELGEVRRGREVGLAAARIMDSLDDRWGQSLCRLYLGHAEAALHRWREAEHAFMDAISCAREAGDPAHESATLFYWASMLVERGDISGAAARAEEAHRLSASLSEEYGPLVGEARRLAAALAAAAGMSETAADLLERATRPEGELGHDQALPRRRALLDLAMLRVDAGRYEEAAAACDDAALLPSEDHITSVMLPLARGLALAGLGRTEQAASELTSAWEAALRGENVTALEKAGDALAELEKSRGGEERASEVLDRLALRCEELMSAEPRQA